MVDQRHDVICRLAAAGAARPGRLRTALAHAKSPARYAVAGLLVAFAALLTLPLQAEAQTVETLVNNLGSIRESYVFVIDCLERQEVGLWTSKVSRCGFRRRAG